MKTAPGPSVRLAARSSPRWARAISRAIARPSPVPSGLVVKNGSNSGSITSGASPGPVSATLATTAWRDGSRRVARRSVPPVAMAWMALVVRLRKTCSRAGGAIATGGRSGSSSTSTRTPFALGGARGQSGGLGQHGVQVAGGQVLGVGPRELEQAGDDLFEPVHLVDEPAERLLVEPDDAALPELGRRADAGQRVADLVGHPRQQLAQGRQPLAPPQLGLEPVALGRLPADGPRQAGGERERQRDPPQRQARGQPIALQRAVDEQRVDQPDHHPGRPDDPPVDHHRCGADRHRDRAARLQLLDGEQHLPLADRGIDLDVDQVGLERRQARLAAIRLGRALVPPSRPLSSGPFRSAACQEAPEPLDQVAALDAFVWQRRPASADSSRSSLARDCSSGKSGNSPAPGDDRAPVASSLPARSSRPLASDRRRSRATTEAPVVQSTTSAATNKAATTPTWTPIGTRSFLEASGIA